MSLLEKFLWLAVVPAVVGVAVNVISGWFSTITKPAEPTATRTFENHHIRHLFRIALIKSIEKDIPKDSLGRRIWLGDSHSYLRLAATDLGDRFVAVFGDPNGPLPDMREQDVITFLQQHAADQPASDISGRQWRQLVTTTTLQLVSVDEREAFIASLCENFPAALWNLCKLAKVNDPETYAGVELLFSCRQLQALQQQGKAATEECRQLLAHIGSLHSQVAADLRPYFADVMGEITALRTMVGEFRDEYREDTLEVKGSLNEINATLLTMKQGPVKSLSITPSPLHTLRPTPTGFVGRTDDLAILRSRSDQPTVLTGLRGMGGIGKTALGLVLAHEWAPRFPDAQLMLDGQGTSDRFPSGTELQSRVINAFHPDAKLPDDPQAIQFLYTQVLKGKHVLILLDNAKDTAQAKPLIPPAGCAFIVTSRKKILLVTQPPHDVGRLPDDEATALLCEFHPALSDEHAAALVKLCAGLPLALRLAGAHLAIDDDASAYIRALSSDRLANFNADAPDAGEVTISETLRLSEAPLTPEQKAAWRALGIFQHSFDERAAAAVIAAQSSPVAVQLDAPVPADSAQSPVRPSSADQASSCTATGLLSLTRRSLVERVGDRYQLHDLGAEYARARLSPAACETLRLAHAQHYIQIGEEADNLYLKGQVVPGLALFDTEREQIEAAFDWLRQRVFPGFSPPNLGKDEDPRDDEARRAKARDYSPARQLIALIESIALTSDLRFHPRQRITWLETQARAARLLPDRAAEGRALGNLGLAHAALGDTRKAIEYYEQALIVSREIGDRRGEGADLGNLGIAHKNLGDARKAIEFYEQQLVVTREIGDRRGEGNALGNLGNAHAALGDARKAIEFYEQRLVIAREIGDRRGECNALWNSARQFHQLGERAEALTRARAALTICEAIEHPGTEQVRAAIAEWEAEG